MSLLRLNEILDKDTTGRSLAKKLGVTPNTVSNWVKGHSLPSGEDLIRIATALDVDIRDLFKSTKTKDAHDLLNEAIKNITVVSERMKNKQDE